MSDSDNPKQHFEITQISPQKNKVTVEDKAFGLIFEVYTPDGDWEAVEIYKNYYLRFTYTNKPAFIVEFME